MKFTYALPLFAIAALAQNEFPDPDYDPPSNGEQVPLDQLTQYTRPIAQSLVTVNGTVVNLDKAIIAFTDITTAPPALAAADVVLQALRQANTDLTPIPMVPADDPTILNLIPYTNSLGYHVNHTIVNLVLKKDLIVSVCAGQIVFQAILNQQSASNTLITTITQKIPVPFDSVVPDLVAPIVMALSSASSAFADQTTLPASCSTTVTTTTTTTTGTATGTVTTSTTTGTGSVYPTGGYGWSNYGSSSSAYPTTSSEGSYPTTSSEGSYPTTSSEGSYYTTSSESSYYSTSTSCDEYESTTTSYSWGGYESSSTYTSSDYSWSTWSSAEPTYYPTSYTTDEYTWSTWSSAEPTYYPTSYTTDEYTWSTWSSAEPTYYPTSYTTSAPYSSWSEAAPTYKPTSTASYSTWAQVTTSTYTYNPVPTYTGAAVANAVKAPIAIAAMAAVALL